MATPTCKKCGSPFSEQEARAGYDTCERCPVDPEPNAASHTPEPWVTVTDEDTGEIEVRPAADASGWVYQTVAQVGRDDIPEDVANARRIVAAANACEGISAEALEAGVIAEMRSALETALAVIEREAEQREPSGMVGYIEEMREPEAIIRAALARVKGATP